MTDAQLVRLDTKCAELRGWVREETAFGEWDTGKAIVNGPTRDANAAEELLNSMCAHGLVNIAMNCGSVHVRYIGRESWSEGVASNLREATVRCKLVVEGLDPDEIAGEP